MALLALVAAGIAAWLLIRGVGDLVSADKQGAELTELEVDSDAVGESLPVNVVVPEGAEDDQGRPLLVFLHGRADDGDGEDSNLNEMYAALADQGDHAPIVAFPSGGEASYWHDRADGDWGTYVSDELIPRVAKEFDAAASAPGPYLSQPVWLDSGDADPFRPGIAAFAADLQAAGAPLTLKIWPGAHEGDYWRSHWDSYMRFYANALEEC